MANTDAPPCPIPSCNTVSDHTHIVSGVPIKYSARRALKMAYVVTATGGKVCACCGGTGYERMANQ